MPTAGAVTSAGQWHWDPGDSRLTLASAGAVAPQAQASVRDYCVDLNGLSEVTLRALRIERAALIGVLADTSDQYTIEDCEIAGCYVNGVRSSSRDRRTDVRIRRNRITDCGGSGIGFGGRLDQWIIEENEVVGCGVLTEHIEPYGDGREAAFQWTSGIKIWGWGGDGWQGYYTIRNNIVRDSLPVAWAPEPASRHGHGIWCDEVLKPTARPEIYGNRVTNCFSRGVYLEKTDDHDAFENLVYHCAQVRYTAPIEAQSNPYGYDVEKDQADPNSPRQVSGNRIFHNTAVGGWWSFSVSCSSRNCSISNTEVRDNIFVGTNGHKNGLYLHGGGANDGAHGSGNTYTNNCFGPEGAAWVWNGTVHRSAAAFEAASGGAVRGTLAVNPRFVAPEAGDYRLRQDSPCIGEATSDGDLGAYPFSHDSPR